MAHRKVTNKELAELIRRTAEAASALIRGDIRTYLTLIKHAEDYTLMDPFGGEPTRAGELMISRSAVSEITNRLGEDYREFSERDLSGIEVEYLFLDAVYESLRRYGAKEAIVAAWCITTDGRKSCTWW